MPLEVPPRTSPFGSPLAQDNLLRGTFAKGHFDNDAVGQKVY
jgi:hypothetical protein